MKVFMQSLGCAKNQVDSEMLLGVLKEHIEMVACAMEAELILLNTCAFIEPARKEAIDTIFELVEVKKETKAKLVVCGCLPQRYKEEIISLIPEVDRFVTIDEYKNLGNILNQVMNSNFHYNKEYSPLNRIYATPNYMRYVKISDGCLNRCAFCAIPLIRGTLKSRTIEDIVSEVTQEVKDGAYEINLISQDTTKYGYDLYKKLALVDLLKELVKIEGDFKIRLLYLYPEIVTDELIKFIKTNAKMMKYFDIPIQHSEDKILKAMLRRSNKKMIIDLLHKIRTEIPDATLRTTLMVGFPFEEEEDVDQMIEFIKEIQFDHMGAFTFSLEENTPATKYPNIIPEDIKIRRYERLMQVQQQIAYNRKLKKISTIISDAFIIGYDEESFMYIARSDEFAPDEIDGCIYVAAKEELSLGQRIQVKILDADAYTLTGEQVE
ncbi:MAG: 30S ribosomal protein S12 methylthiotransferase RimO [Anaeroplasmataceae bacterium]|nr:30S ribosomal protein S12 methylthiotransferase RimO [Anaeroplasmataceae bacterium]